MPFEPRTADLAVLNTLTKYPSIPTYHQLDPGSGALLAETVAFTGPVLGTEKVDGSNARIISLPDGTFLLGSREELLYAKGDLLSNPAQGIVAALRPIAQRLAPVTDAVIRVHYLEVYGGRITAASKQYTGERAVSCRLFDCMVLPGYAELLTRQPAQLADWRDTGGQPYLDEPALTNRAATDGLTLTPRLFTIDATELPTDLAETRAFLAEHLPETRSAAGAAEGIVLRGPDRSTIAKARFQDYDRTLRRRR